MPTHAEQRVLPHRPDQMFDLVADVEKYPEFLPWCIGCRIRRRRGNVIIADLVIGFKMIRERFTSQVTLDHANRRIDVQYLDGPFRYLNNHWSFQEHEKGCKIEFFIDFEFRTKLLQRLIEPLFNEAVKRMVRAFETRADELYGRSAERSSATQRSL